MGILQKIGLLKNKNGDHAHDSIDPETIKHYNKLRPAKVHKTFCQAPLNNLYFSWEGKVIACCFNQEFVLGTYPEMSIKEIWNGVKATELRKSLEDYDLTNGCQVCHRDIQAKRYEMVNSLRFDEYQPTPFPVMMEFQISNTCNLECVMCDGFLSSAIRANREKLPAIPEKYDSKFVDQLTEFIPHLKYTTFSGGEPFLIKTYYDIWNVFATVNPNCTIKVITNGTIYNDRVKNILEKNNFHITISLDSPNKQTYESIRKGASFDHVIENANRFNAYCKSKKTHFNFNFCPMINNWHEIPDFIDLCNTMDASFHFSVVYHPLRLSLSSLPSTELNRIISSLSQFNFTPQTPIHRQNKKQLDGFISLIKGFSQQNENYRPDQTITEDEVIEALFKRIDEFEKRGELEHTEELKLKLKEAILLSVPFNINYALLRTAIDQMTVENFIDNSRASVDNLKGIIIQKYTH